MIAFSKWFLRLRKKPIRLQQPGNFVLIRGADKERIFGIYDEQDRLRKLVVHTRQP